MAAALSPQIHATASSGCAAWPRHMARYYVIAGEPEPAKLCLLAAADVEKDFAHSRLVQMLAQHTIEWLGELADSALLLTRSLVKVCHWSVRTGCRGDSS
jgi:hypothetical protein